MGDTKMSLEEFQDWLDVMTPEELRMVVEIGERMLAERRRKESPDSQPQA